MIDLAIVRDSLREANALARSLDGRELEDDSGRKSPQAADLNRDLNRLADLLTLCGALVRGEVWVGKGWPDPLGRDPLGKDVP